MLFKKKDTPYHLLPYFCSTCKRGFGSVGIKWHINFHKERGENYKITHTGGRKGPDDFDMSKC